MNENGAPSGSKLKLLLPILSGGGFLSTIAPFIVILLAILAPAYSIATFFSGDDDNVEETESFNWDDYSAREQKCILDFGVEDPESEEGKTTISYCEELYKVVEDYHKNYGVSINPVLITATLFYGKDYGGYENDYCDFDGDTSCEGNSEYVSESNFSTWFSDPAFTKKAKKYIKTLAGYMIKRTESTYSCGNNPHATFDPVDVKSLAYGQYTDKTKKRYDSGSGAAIQYAEYEMAYIGDKSLPGSCPYENDGPKFEAAFKKTGDYRELMKQDPPKSKNYVFDPDKCPYPQYHDPYVKNVRTYDGCAQSPKETIIYTADYGFEGLYYHRLMAPMRSYFLWIFPYESDDSFISKYYEDYVKDDNGNIIEDNVIDMVYGIYDMYETIMGSQYFDFSDLGIILPSGGGYGNTVVTGDWVTWSQKHSAWANIPIGSSTIYAIGCTSTSVAKIIAMSGASANFIGGSEFNPGTFVQAMSANRGYNGNLFVWGAVSNVVPGFNFYQDIDCEAQGRSCIQDAIQWSSTPDYYVVAQVYPRANMHWVAVVPSDDGQLMISDTVAPEGVNETVKPFSQSNYRDVYRIVVFQYRG